MEAADSWDKIRNTQITHCNLSTALTSYGTSLSQLKSQGFKGKTSLLLLLLRCELTKTEEDEKGKSEKTQQNLKKKKR